ncbi:MAG: hypothetical protein ACK4K9_07915 [Bacteroidia bacterium]
MKKIFLVLFVAATLSSCHYLQGEARETLETNEKYKSEKADYSVNRANVSVQKEETQQTTDTTAASAN